MVVVAHAGHWLPQIVFAAPVLIVFLLLAWSKIQDRRHGRSEEEWSEPSLDEIMDDRERN